MKCRFCGNGSFIPFADLQHCPPSNSMVRPEDIGEPEVYYPLQVEVCDRCFLAQVEEHKKASDIFNEDYTYFSSYSASWVEHARRFADDAITRFGLGANSRVIEVASNDGYLLQHFNNAGVPVLGVEPTANTAAVATGLGIETIVDFFGADFATRELVQSGRQGNLICGNNVFAHVPDINDFTAGLKIALAPGGVVALEFPHLLRLVEETQFDTIYHEHFSYLSLAVTQKIFEAHGLKVFDVQQLSTHGGSLRVFGAHAGDESKPVTPAVAAVVEQERQAGLQQGEVYRSFQSKIDEVRAGFLEFLLAQRKANKTVVGYGAAAKGNTLLNYSGVHGSELVRFVADLSPHKQGKLLPGSHIPVVDPSEIDSARPDYIVIFPWNLRAEVMQQLAHARDWDAKFVVAVPHLTIL